MPCTSTGCLQGRQITMPGLFGSHADYSMHRLKILISQRARWLVRLLRSGQYSLLKGIQRLLGILPRMGFTSRILGPPRGITTVANLCAENGSNAPKVRLSDSTPGMSHTRKLKPMTIHASVFAGFQAERTYTTEPFFMLEGPGFSCCGEHSFAILSEDDLLIDEFSFDIWTNHWHHVFRRLKPPKPYKVEGRLCAILESQAGTYGHWLLDFVPRFARAKAALDQRGEKVRYLIEYRAQPHERELLVALGFAESDIEPRKPGIRYDADYWFLPSPTSRSAMNLSRESIDTLRSLFPAAVPAAPAGRRLYLSRSHDRFRRILNEPEVIRHLEDHGFEVVSPTDLTLLEQAQLFASAEAVVSVISSGLANMVFLPPQSAVIEIFPEDFFLPIQWSLADLCELRYYYFFASGSQPAAIEGIGNRHADLHVNISALENTLKLAGL